MDKSTYASWFKNSTVTAKAFTADSLMAMRKRRSDPRAMLEDEFRGQLSYAHEQMMLASQCRKLDHEGPKEWDRLYAAMTSRADQVAADLEKLKTADDAWVFRKLGTTRAKWEETHKPKEAK